MIKKVCILLTFSILIMVLCACNPSSNPGLEVSSKDDTATSDTNIHYTTGDLDTYYKTIIPVTDKTPSEVISRYDRLASWNSDGGYPVAIFYQGRPFFHQGKTLTALEKEEWTEAGTLNGPVYPWVRPKEDFVSNCLPERTVLYVKSQNDTVILAVKYQSGFAVFE